LWDEGGDGVWIYLDMLLATIQNCTVLDWMVFTEGVIVIVEI